MPQSPWKSLELISGQNALPRTWRLLLGNSFAAFKLLCLEPGPGPAGLIPCPNLCGCDHRIIGRHDRTGAIAICRCLPATNCPDIEMTLEEATPIHLDVPKLARALARTLGCQSAQANISPLNTLQIGSWSSAAVPVFLTLQVEPRDLQSSVDHLAATLRDKFILLTPTNDLVTAETRQVLTTARAAIFDLASNVAIKQDGTIHPITDPAALFLNFTPEADRPPSLRTPHSEIRTPKYALRKGLGVWHLIFDGQEAFIRHESGMFYVCWLLYHPDECPIHAIDLMAKIPDIYRQQLGLPSIIDPATGKTVILQSDARLQERSLALDDRESMRRLYKKQQELEAILDSNDETEPVKDEALRELEQIVEFQHKQGRRSQDAAQKAVRSVRRAITRCHHTIYSALDRDGNPNTILQSFGLHLEKHLLLPSARHSGAARSGPRGPLAGRFTYESTPGIVWEQ